ncbi:unnamed protein product [Dicrocoelium dendriticum]|nr:unnamed protein product [Dicrocoelium dendriticum]
MKRFGKVLSFSGGKNGARDDFRQKKSKTDGEHIKMSINAARKAKVHGQRVIAMLYCFIVLSIGLAVSLYCTGRRTAELEHAFVWFFTLMYLTSVIGMLYLLAYIFYHRNASLEAVEKGDITASKILFSMRGEPVSLYLRIGLCIFAILAIVFSMCRAKEISVDHDEYEKLIPYTATKVLFFIVQPIFLLLLHRLVLLTNVNLFSFILLHLLTMNLCIWVESAIEKISRAMPSDHHTEHGTPTVHHVNPTVTGYFLPAIPEYCAIAVAVIYEMSQRIGQVKQIEAHRPHTKKKPRRCRGRIYTSLIFSVILFVFVLMVILFLENAGKVIDHFRAIVHLSEISIIHIFALVLTIAGMIHVKRLKFSVNFAKNNLDEKLLMITFFLTVNFMVVESTMCIFYLINESLEKEKMIYMGARLASAVLELVQVVVQTYFIHDMFYRCCHHESYQRSKPGRAMIVILAALNFALWMIYSFQVKHNDVLFLEGARRLEAAGLHGSHMFLIVTLPMVMLFRYHSSVCLAISFVRIYEDEVTRYESMLRWMRQGESGEILQNKPTNLDESWHKGDDIIPMLQEYASKQTTANGTPRTPSPKQRSPVQQECAEDISVAQVTMDLGELESIEEEAEPATYQTARRDTQANWELARMRLAAAEVGRRKIELKLREQRKKARLASKSAMEKGSSGQDAEKEIPSTSNY